MTTVPPALKPVRDRWSGVLLTVLFLVAAALLFLFVYYALPGNQHFGALILIGVLALLFALGSYLAESLSREPTAQRSLAWGFFGMGFAVLFLTIALGPSYGVLSTTYMLLSLLIVVVVLIVAVALIAWRGRAVRATENQQVPRAAWRQEPAPNAFNYAAANSPSVPATSPPAPPNSPPPRSP
jgi:MFS family permease